MRAGKKSLSHEQLFEQVTKSIKIDNSLVRDVDRILEGMEYKELVDKVGEQGLEAQVFLAEHPEAQQGLELAKKVFSRVLSS